jgi:hypothetical protein
VLNYEYFQASFKKTKAGATGPILDILFICIRISGKIVILTNIDESIRTSHQGSPKYWLDANIKSLIGSIIGSKGLKKIGTWLR